MAIQVFCFPWGPTSRLLGPCPQGHGPPRKHRCCYFCIGAPCPSSRCLAEGNRSFSLQFPVRWFVSRWVPASLPEPPPPPGGEGSSRGRRGQGETNPLPLPLPRPLPYPLPTATRTPATQCPPGQKEWRGRGRNRAGGKGQTKEGNRTGQTALAENGAERRRGTRKGKTGKNHCGCWKPLSGKLSCRCTPQRAQVSA